MAARRSTRAFRLVAGPLLLAVLVAACGSTAVGSAGTASTGAPATPGPAAGSSSGAGSPGDAGAGASPGTPGEADPAAPLLIGSPYALTALPAATAANLQATFTKDLGAFGKAVRVGARAVTQGGANEGFLLAVGFPRQTLDDKTYGDAVATLELGAEQSFSKQVISNVDVTIGVLGAGFVGMFRKGDTLVIVLAASSGIVVPAITALIAANG
jgi:hypothetical protein